MRPWREEIVARRSRILGVTGVLRYYVGDEIVALRRERRTDKDIAKAVGVSPVTAAVVALVPTSQAGMASAITVVMRQGAFAIGVAILGSLVSLPD